MQQATGHDHSGRTALGVLALAAVLALCSYARLVLIMLVLAVIVALLFEPMVAWLNRHHVPRAIGSALVIALVSASTLGVCWVFYGRAEAFLSQLPTYREEIRSVVRTVQERASRLEKTTREVLPQAGDGKQVVPVKNIDQSRVSELAAKVGPLGEALLAISFLPFLSYFMLSWAPHVRVRTAALFAPENRRAAQASLDQIVTMVRKFVVGNLIAGLLIGAVATVTFGFVGVPFFYFVGFVSGFVNLVPYLGILLAPLLPLIVSLGHVHMTGVIVILTSTLVLHLVALNVVYPKLVGESLRLNPLASTLGLLFFAWLWGPMGLLFAIPITAAVKIVCDHIDRLKPYGAWLGTHAEAGPDQRRQSISRRWHGTILHRGGES